MKFSKRLDRFPEYIFSHLARQITEVEKKTGRKVLSFGAGSPDFPPSKIYIDKLKEYLDEPGSHLYPGYGAIPELSEGVRGWYKKRFGVHLESHELLPLSGSKDGISHLPLALCNEGDEILVPDPGYPAFSGPALMIGVKPVYYNLLPTNNFKIDIHELENKVTRKTSYIWVNFPSNPTGQVVSMAELQQLVAFAKRHAIWLIYDNAYAEITFDGYVAPSILQIEGAKDVAVELGSFSKMFSFAGFRMGWVVGNRQVIEALTKIKSQMDSGLSLPLQKLGGYALTHPDDDWHKRMIASYTKRRNLIINYLARVGLEASNNMGGLYLWIKIPVKYADSEAYATELLEEKQILVTPGTAFGKNGSLYVRVSFCVTIDSINEYISL
jgi:LL-diaminopimelate aminotransferase